MRLVTGWMVATLLLAQPGEIIDRVLAIVAGDVITLSDVVAARDLGFVAPASAQVSERNSSRGHETLLHFRVWVSDFSV